MPGHLRQFMHRLDATISGGIIVLLVTIPDTPADISDKASVGDPASDGG